jgi:hypothetical protein
LIRVFHPMKLWPIPTTADREGGRLIEGAATGATRRWRVGLAAAILIMNDMGTPGALTRRGVTGP